MKTKGIILLTGFEPFGGLEKNPSWESIQPFNDKIYEGYRTLVVQMPVHDLCKERLAHILKSYQPKIIVSFGVYFSKTIALENFAVEIGKRNIDDTKIFSTKLPTERIAKALRGRAVISQSAGKYYCEYLFWNLMNFIKDTDQIGGFVHVPLSGISERDIKIILKESIKEYEGRINNNVEPGVRDSKLLEISS
jgi:pyroglutamyl-peptidase